MSSYCWQGNKYRACLHEDAPTRTTRILCTCSASWELRGMYVPELVEIACVARTVYLEITPQFVSVGIVII